jgi:hypothetical protein
MGLLVSSLTNPCQCGGSSPPPVYQVRTLDGQGQLLVQDSNHRSEGHVWSAPFSYESQVIYINIAWTSGSTAYGQIAYPDGSFDYPATAQCFCAIRDGLYGNFLFDGGPYAYSGYGPDMSMSFPNVTLQYTLTEALVVQITWYIDSWTQTSNWKPENPNAPQLGPQPVVSGPQPITCPQFTTVIIP